jgi:hypothetical protein
MLRKPHWLPAATFTALMQQCDGIPRCKITGDTEDLSIDHIVPKFDGGSDALDNLQILKKSLNSSKGTRPDPYWSTPFYFDQVPILQQCRAAQRGLYNALLAQSAWFGEPISTIARLLYITPQVVGAGKTLAPLIMACAYNAISRAHWGFPRRADRILVLCKEQAIRDQLAVDIHNDPKRFGIFPKSPRVLIIKHGDQLDSDGLLQAYDIVVSCIQQLWDRPDGNLSKLLHKFPLINIDEPHYAIEQVQAIVNNAATSLCFGTTGSPIDALGRLLPQIINVFAFTYRNADDEDKSMKFIDGGNWENNITTVALDTSTQLDRGLITQRTDTRSHHYGKNLEPAKQVAWEVIRYVERCDKISIATADKAPHRLLYDCNLSVFYPVHAMITADSVRFGNHLCRTMNEYFDSNRDRFPRELGFACEIVHAEGEEPDGSKRGHKPLSPGHAWMRAKDRPNYQLDAECCRFLIVVGMGREGVNNPLCGAVGITSDHATIIEVVQRILGRQIRAVIKHTDNDLLCVPPKQLDSIRIITHDAFEAIRTDLQNGIDYLLNMETHLDGLTTVLDLLNEEEPEIQLREDQDIPVPFVDKIDIAGIIGENPKVDDQILIKSFVKHNPAKEEAIKEWIDLVRKEPGKAGDQLRLNRTLKAIPTVLREDIRHQPTDNELRNFLSTKKPHLAQEPISNANRAFIYELFFQDAIRVNATTPLIFNPDGSPRSLDDIRKSLGGSVLAHVGRHFDMDNASKQEKEVFWKLVSSAMRQILGVPPRESASNESQWNIPNCQIILEWSDVQRDMRCWIIGQMIREDMLPSMAHLCPSAAAVARSIV